MSDKMLSCGHKDDWGGGSGAYDLAGNSFCKACLNARERIEMQCRDAYFSYISSDERTVGDWGGGVLATIKPQTMRKHRSVCGLRVLWTFDATDTHGNVWACRHWPNAGQYVRMRCKLRISPFKGAAASQGDYDRGLDTSKGQPDGT